MENQGFRMTARSSRTAWGLESTHRIVRLLQLSLLLGALLASQACIAQATDKPADQAPSAEMQAVIDKAKSGDTAAQFRLATAYDWGRGMPRNGEEARRWYTAAANQGYAEAQNSLGSILQAEKNYAEARVWYEKAAAQRHALGTNSLAYLYDAGLGVPQDRQKAFALYTESAEEGWGEAMFNLSVMYGAGQLDGKRDLLQACTCNTRAQRFAGSNQKLRDRTDRASAFLATKLSPDDQRVCREHGSNWSPRSEDSGFRPPVAAPDQH